MSKKVNCKNCGEEIDAKALVCPKCGVKVKKPVYKKPWFISLVVIVIIAAIASAGGDENKTLESNENTKVQGVAEEIIYEEYSVSKLISDLEDNALKAEKSYDGKNVKITGKVGVIDSDGDYISLEPSDNPYSLTNVSCYLTDEAQLDVVMELSIGQTVTVYGDITSVGEILGYSLDIHKFED